MGLWGRHICQHCFRCGKCVRLLLDGEVFRRAQCSVCAMPLLSYWKIHSSPPLVLNTYLTTSVTASDFLFFVCPPICSFLSLLLTPGHRRHVQDVESASSCFTAPVSVEYPPPPPSPPHHLLSPPRPPSSSPPLLPLTPPFPSPHVLTFPLTLTPPLFSPPS